MEYSILKIPELMPIFVALLTGLFLLSGYLFQKYLERKNAVNEKKLETYSMFIKSMFASMEARIQEKVYDGSEEIFWKAQISLYGSDEIIRKFGAYSDKLRQTGKASNPCATTEVLATFDELMLAMRKDINPKSHVTAKDLRRISPILSDI